VRLLQRTTRTLRLTDAGRVYFDRARAALSGLEEATAMVGQLGKQPRGTVRVTAPVDIGVHVMADLVARFLREHPQIHVELSLTARTVDLVQEGFDLAVRAGRLVDSTLVARKVGSTGIALWASPAYLKKRGAPRSVAELVSHDCVLFRAPGGRATWKLVGPDGEETVEVTGRLVVDEMSFVRRAVGAGLGIGLVPRFLAGCADEGGELVRVLPERAVRGASIYVVSPPVRYEPAAVSLFREFLVAELLQVAWTG
jgi:DNA-binding transcriptional LysR family regulator